jgi:hypothetical protein
VAQRAPDAGARNAAEQIAALRARRAGMSDEEAARLRERVSQRVSGCARDAQLL